jgi:predicted PurR-regulated permease PerM
MLRNAELTESFGITRSSIVIVLLAALVLATAGLFTTSVSVLLLVFAGLLFGVFLSGISRWVAKHSPLSYLVSYLTVSGLMFVVAAAGLYYLGAQVARRADELAAKLQTGTQQLGNTLSQYEWAKQFVPQSTDWQSTVGQTLSVDNASAILPSLFNGLQWATWANWANWAMTGGLVILFVGLYAAYNPDLYRDGLVKLLPKDGRQRTEEVLDYLNAALARWIMGRFFSMAIVGVLTAIGLWIWAFRCRSHSALSRLY